MKDQILYSFSPKSPKAHTYLLKMVLSQRDKLVIQNDYEEHGWTAYRICKEHPSKQWVLSSVKRLIKKIQSTGSIARKPGSGRPVSVTTEENCESVREMILSQEEPGTHQTPRTIERGTGLSTGMDFRKAQCNDNRVPGLRLRDTIHVPGISGTGLRDRTQGHDRVPYLVPIVSLIRVP